TLCRDACGPGGIEIMAARQSSNPGAQRRLSPEMASFRALVLAFVREYIEAWSLSPSYGEIAAHCECSIGRVRDALKALVREGKLIKVRGPRGLRLPTEHAAALKALIEAGYRVDESARIVTHLVTQGEAGKSTHSPLLPPPELTYPSDPRRDEPGDGQEAPVEAPADRYRKRSA
ncbi:MAG: hypothetical protein AAF650_04800, partial [Pseudomonadota bacterium]